jgi:putative redox-active protein with C_GCAxxG_C_C motif
VNRAFGEPSKPEAHAAAPLAGGIVRNGYQCGMVWGAALAGGAEAYRRLGAGSEAEAASLTVARRAAESFRAQNGAVDCFDLTETDFGSTSQTWKYLLSGKPLGCFRMAARYAPAAFAEIRTSLGDEHVDAPPAPVSCSALAARRLGASDLHAVMAAGFAGGIGLSGGACGALGAVVWLDAMRGGGSYKDVESRAARIVERFLEASGHRFECSEIVGRRFVDVADHAGYLRGGGCAGILEALCAERAAQDPAHSRK